MSPRLLWNRFALTAAQSGCWCTLRGRKLLVRSVLILPCEFIAAMNADWLICLGMGFRFRSSSVLGGSSVGRLAVARGGFTERLPHTVAPYARRTKRLSQAMEWFTLALGGEAGARLARRLGVLTSSDILIRQLRHRSLATSATPRILGIDDWAWRKGQRYGTILCDLNVAKSLIFFRIVPQTA